MSLIDDIFNFDSEKIDDIFFDLGEDFGSLIKSLQLTNLYQYIDKALSKLDIERALEYNNMAYKTAFQWYNKATGELKRKSKGHLTYILSVDNLINNLKNTNFKANLNKLKEFGIKIH